MTVNRKDRDGDSPVKPDGPAGMVAPTPGTRSTGTPGSRSSGEMRAPPGGGTQRERPDKLRSRTDRGNQNDDDIGSSASGGGGGEANAPWRTDAPDLDPTSDIVDRSAPQGSSGNPDVTGTKDVLE
jgi:hypothetical protein